MESPDEVLLTAEEKMEKSADFLQEQFSGVRTGKASPSLVENISIEYYGTTQRLRDLAGISTPEPRLIVVNAFDPSSLSAIEKAILAANLGVTPMNDGRVIRVPIPELSEDRRKELLKVASRMAEEARVAIRSIRREANDQAKALRKSGTISEDEQEQLLKEIQRLTDEYVKKADDALRAKEHDVMEV